MNKIGIACDHAGYELKELLTGYLASKGFEVFDYGCTSEESCDYPDFAAKAAQAPKQQAKQGGDVIAEAMRSAAPWNPIEANPYGVDFPQ